ncbi:MAG: AIM24 family protein [Planctomycetota bacterium]
MGGFKSFFFSGEGLVCRFNGQGKVWVQTRQVPAFSSWISPFRPKKSSND